MAEEILSLAEPQIAFDEKEAPVQEPQTAAQETPAETASEEAQPVKKAKRSRAKAEPKEATEEQKPAPQQAKGEPDLKDAAIFEQLSFLQQNISAPKDAKNADEGFMYRTENGVLSVLKPLLDKCGCVLYFIDEVLRVTEVYIYLKTTAVLRNRKGETFESVGFAREDLTLPGKSASQITGSCSTYAHKYALRSMFLLTDEPVKAAADPDAGCYRTPVEKLRMEKERAARAAQEKPAEVKAVSAEQSEDVRPEQPKAEPPTDPSTPWGAEGMPLLTPESNGWSKCVMYLAKMPQNLSFESFSAWIRERNVISDEHIHQLLQATGKE